MFGIVHNVPATAQHDSKFPTIRKMVWIDQPHVRGWGCSQCAWVFNPSDPPTGENYEEMKQNFESRRDKEFASHDCAKYPHKHKPIPDAT